MAVTALDRINCRDQIDFSTKVNRFSQQDCSVILVRKLVADCNFNIVILACRFQIEKFIGCISLMF